MFARTFSNRIIFLVLQVLFSDISAYEVSLINLKIIFVHFRSYTSEFAQDMILSFKLVVIIAC